jgi:hypothetical protein
MKTQSFVVKVEDKDVNLEVRSPSLQDQREASKVYNQAFSDALKAKAVVRAKLDDLLKDQGLWDDTKQAKFNELQSIVLQNERKLAKGGIPLSEAKKIALEMKETREKIRDLISVKTNLDVHTAEGQADNARFNYLVSACTVYKDNQQKYFTNLDDYLVRSSEEAAIKSAQNLANMLYGLDNDYESSLPENKFLKQYKFIDDKLRLLNKKGQLVDEDGRLIDESGRFIDEKGNFVDKFGNPVDKDGEYIVESQPFLDDDGKPIILETKKEEVKSATTEAPTTVATSSNA